MSHEAKRWIGNTVIAVVVAAVGVLGWTVLIDKDDATSGGRTPVTGAPLTSDQAGASTGTTTTAPPEATPTYINAAPGETPPVRPPDEMSDAGFEAFVRYFVQTMDWAVATMDPTLLDQASSPDCGLCNSVIRKVTLDVEAQRRYEGGRYTLAGLSVNPNLSPDGSRRNAGYWWDASEYTVYDADGAVMQHDPAAQAYEYSLNAQFEDGRWSAVALLFVERNP